MKRVGTSLYSWGWPPALSRALAVPTSLASTPSLPLGAGPKYSTATEPIAHIDMRIEGLQNLQAEFCGSKPS